MIMTAKIVDRNGNEVESELMTPQEVAQTFRVDPKTVTRWAKAGKLTAIRTLGGHRRYLKTEVDELLQVGRTERVVTPVLSAV